MRPFPFIEELKGLDAITGINDLIRVMGVVYSLVPYTADPYVNEIKYEDIEGLYGKFKRLELGGWCGLNAEVLKWILEGYRRQDPYNLRFYSHNHGIHYGEFTHVGVIAEINRMKFYLDPYFNRYYVHADGFPLQFENLMYLIQERKYDQYRSVFIGGKKPVFREDGSIVYLSSIDFHKECLYFFETRGLSTCMTKVFNDTNPDLLMMLKIPD